MSEATSIRFCPSLQDRLLDKVKRDPARGCWLFTGHVLPKSGYGQIGVGNRKLKLAHRVSYELFCGPIADGLMCLHKCDVRNCVNPAHLFLGTGSDNMRDAIVKGRQMQGETHYLSKLTAEQVQEIRRQLLAGVPYRKIAKSFGVGERTIQSIRYGKSWTCLPGFTPPPLQRRGRPVRAVVPLPLPGARSGG